MGYINGIHVLNFQELFDPSIWSEESCYTKLAAAQKEDMERREKERKEKTKVRHKTKRTAPILPVFLAVKSSLLF